MIIKFICHLITFVMWLQQTSLRRLVGVIGAITLLGIAFETLKWILGIQIKITSSLFPELLASVFSFVIYYGWAIALWKIISFFKKPEPEPVEIKHVHLRDYDASLN